MGIKGKIDYNGVLFYVPEGIEIACEEQRALSNCYELFIPEEDVCILVNIINNRSNISTFFTDEEKNTFVVTQALKSTLLGKIEGNYIVYKDKITSYAEFMGYVSPDTILNVLIIARKRHDILDILDWSAIKELLDSFSLLKRKTKFCLSLKIMKNGQQL